MMPIASLFLVLQHCLYLCAKQDDPPLLCGTSNFLQAIFSPISTKQVQQSVFEAFLRKLEWL
jgi:hypothetical protein